MFSRGALVLFVAVGVAPALALAGWMDFVPRPLQNEVYLDVFASFERDNLSADTRPSRWSDIFVKEKLTLFSNGYSYHPRFLQYQLSLGGALSQEDYETSHLEPIGWRYGSGLEYSVRVTFLPEHPYNLLLFDTRYEPVYKGQSATSHDSVGTSRGASFRYRKKPYFLHTGFINDTIESAEASSDVKKVNLDGEYFKRFASGNELSFNGAFNPAWFSSSQGLEGRETEYLLSNLVNLQRVRVNSNLTMTTSDQASRSSGKIENNSFLWYELLNANLPWNFKADFSYRYQQDKSTLGAAGPSPNRSLSDKGDDLRFDLVHRLYKSLDTTYTFQRGTGSSFGSETTSLSNALAFNYSKSIPRGTLLASVNLARAGTNSRGQGTDVVNEPHSAVFVPTGTFVLNQQNVAGDSIIVLLRSSEAPFELVRLLEDEHYTLRPVPNLNTFEIQVYNLPAQFVVPGTYEFFVSYALAAGDYELQTDTFNSTASVELFDNLLAPYVSYSTVRSDVLSGVFSGIPVDSVTYTGGLRAYLGPLRARGEYQVLDWDVSPYEAWTVELQYVGSPLPTVSVYATASYLSKYYRPGTSAYYSSSFTENTVSGSGSIQKRLVSPDMFLSVGGSYSRLQGRVDSEAYTLNASWNWKIGRLDLSIGANAYLVDSSGTTSFSARRDHEFFYVRLRRQLL